MLSQCESTAVVLPPAVRVPTSAMCGSPVELMSTSPNRCSRPPATGLCRPPPSFQPVPFGQAPVRACAPPHPYGVALGDVAFGDVAPCDDIPEPFISAPASCCSAETMLENAPNSDVPPPSAP